MKKLILSLVFVFATGTSFMNANSSEKINEVQVDCIAFAFEYEDILNFEMSYERFSRFVDRCNARYN